MKKDLKTEAENLFIKKLEVYLDEDFNDYTKRRISGYLQEYAELLPSLIIKEKSKEPLLRNNDLNRVLERRRRGSISNDEILIKAQEYCIENEISINDFVSNGRIRNKRDIINHRKNFVNLIVDNYICSNNQMAEFFGINHSTITYYLYGKPCRLQVPTTHKHEKNINRSY